ncbi:phosphoadenylyl-sulfate reductase [Pseudochelatococcus sp. B33]
MAQRQSRPDDAPQARPDLARVEALNVAYGDLPAEEVLRVALTEVFPGRIALVSSFGAESAVLLHLASRIDPAVPVVFIDTGRLFPETLAYRDTLVARLGLSDVRSVGPDPETMEAADPYGALFSIDPDRCCHLRKVEPLAGALTPFTAWITGRKRFQASTRLALPVFETDATHIKVSPLATWGAGELVAYLRQHDLPRHPLVAKGYPSIGCAPCTSPVAPGEDPRAGRWRGQAKTECGIHVSAAGVTKRSA